MNSSTQALKNSSTQELKNSRTQEEPTVSRRGPHPTPIRRPADTPTRLSSPTPHAPLESHGCLTLSRRASSALHGRSRLRWDRVGSELPTSQTGNASHRAGTRPPAPLSPGFFLPVCHFPGLKPPLSTRCQRLRTEHW